MKKHLAVLSVFIFLFIVSALPGASEDSLLGGDLPGGFKLTRPVAFYNPGNLFELIDGQAVFYLSYGFRLLEHAFYEKGGDTYSVDIYELADRLSAFGSFHQQKDEDAAFMDVSCEGYAIDYLAVFYKDRYYVEIIPAASPDNAVETMTAFALQVEKRIPGTGVIPPEIALLPEENIVPGSIRYFGENLISYTFMGKGLTAQYTRPGGGKNLTAFISFAENEESARTIGSAFRGNSTGAEDCRYTTSGVTLTGINGTLPYRGNAVLYIYRTYVLGFLGYDDIAETHPLTDVIVKNLSGYDSR